MSQLNQGHAVGAEGDNTSKWEEIDVQLKEMFHLTDNLTISSSPANAVVHPPSTRFNPVHNPIHRRSEGYLDERPFDSRPLQPPIQSAPILADDCNFAWGDPAIPQVVQKNVSVQGKDSQMIKLLNGQTTSRPYLKNAHSSQDQSHIPLVNPSTRHIASTYSPVPVYEANISSGHGLGSRHGSGSNSPQVHRKLSSPNPKSYQSSPPGQIFVSGHSKPTIQHSQSAYNMYASHLSTSSQAAEVFPPSSPASMRRSSMPVRIDNNAVSSKAPVAKRANSQQQAHASNFSSVLSQAGDFYRDQLDKVDELADVPRNSDDQEYTIALLQHQEDRMNRLQTDLEAKKSELLSLVVEMQFLENQMSARGARNSSSLQLDVGRLREINRQLEIDCNCMHKEVELFYRDGDNTRDNFYSRYNPNPKRIPPVKRKGLKYPDHKDLPPPPVPPPQELDDEPKWRCTYCTFDNHAALNKCEMCEFARDVQSSRVRMS